VEHDAAVQANILLPEPESRSALILLAASLKALVVLVGGLRGGVDPGKAVGGSAAGNGAPLYEGDLETPPRRIRRKAEAQPTMPLPTMVMW
jgi:hypothetical protein